MSGQVSEFASRDAQTLEGAWMRCMRRGDFESAWQLSDGVLTANRGQSCWHQPRHQQFVWDGSSLHGRRVLIRCYHGLGDTIQFIRYAKKVKAVAREVIVWAQPVLLPLLQTVDGIDRLLPLHDGTPDVEFEVDVEVMELPHVFRSTLANLPADVPYIRIERQNADGSRHSRARVGLVWRAGQWDGQRSVPAAVMAQLAAQSDVEFHILQDRVSAQEWMNPNATLICTEPVSELAKAIAAMDLLITIDSLPAHLGGALGIPTWTLLPARADWRWMEQRSDSPWYPTMRLFRQQTPGDWQDVIAHVAAELLAFTARWHDARAAS